MSLTDTREPAAAPAPARHRGRLAVLIGTGVLLVGVLASLPLLISRPVPRPQPPHNVIQGPSFPAATVTNAAGELVTCALGATPTVNITNAYFTPKLAGGTSFAPGDYQIELTGTIANETTQPIVVTALHPSLGGQPWRTVTVTAPDRLAANSSGTLTLRGSFHSTATAQADVGATVSWQWADPRFVACGDKGLIDDD